MTRIAAEAENSAAHSLAVRHGGTLMLSSVQDAEEGQRGYLLTGDPSYLAPYETALTELPPLQAKLRELVLDNPDQLVRLDALNADIASKMAELDQAVSLQKSGDTGGALALIKTNRGRDLMERIRTVSDAFDDAEAALFQMRETQVANQRGLLTFLVALALAAAATLAWFVWTEARRHAAQLALQNQMLQTEATERQRAEAQLRQSQKMESLGQLTGGVAHDFNNMLAVIVGNLDMLTQYGGADVTRMRRYAQNALNGATRAAALTQRLLAFSRMQPLDPQPVDVNKSVQEMSEMLRRALGEPVAVETVLSGGLWRAFVDAPQLESAILNLAVNARDAMPGGGKLTIETSNAALDKAYCDSHPEVEPGQYVLLAITDTGHGMAPEVIERAFDPFYTTKRPGEGTGLGLSQVHGFLRQSHGHVKLYSEVGVGTTVKLYLPRDTSGKQPVAAPVALVSQPIEGRFTVLVVEDNAEVRDFAAAASRELGFTVLVADGAAAALEILEQHSEVSVLLTDVVMPGINGRELADAAAALRPGLRIVYMTGYTRNAIVHNGVLDGGTRLLTKPFTLDQLDRELRDALADAWPVQSAG